MSVDNGDILQAVVDFVDSDGNHCQNKYAFLAQFAAAQPEVAVLAAIGLGMEAIYDAISARVNAGWDDPVCYVDEISWTGLLWEVVRNVGQVVVNTAFSNVSEILPYQSAAYLVGNTEKPKSRGRKFMPPFGEDSQASGYLTAPAYADLVDAAIAYLDDLEISSGNTLIPGVPSKTLGQFLPLIATMAAQLIGTQRRRKPGVGV